MVKIEIAEPVAKKVKILLYGPSGSHKTLSALTFPRVLLVDAESGSDLYAGRPDIPTFHRARIKTVRELREVCETIREDNGLTWNTLVVDPITIFYDTAKNLVSNNAEKDIDYRGWAKINNQMGSLYNLLIGLPVHVVIIAREATEYSGSGNSLQKVGVKPDADKDLIYNMDFVIHMSMDGSAEVQKSRGGVLGKNGKLASVSWADFEPISQLYVAGKSLEYVSEEQTVEAENNNLANKEVAEAFYKHHINKGLTNSDILAALGGITRWSEWTKGRAEADKAVAAYVQAQIEKSAAPKPNGSDSH